MTTSENKVNALIQLVHELSQFTETMEHGGEEQRDQAKKLLAEVQHLLTLKNEWTILRVIEASVVPKMIKLAKEIHLYRLLTGQHQARKEKQRYRAPRPQEITHNTGAYDAFIPKEQQPEPTPSEKIAIEQIIQDLYQQLGLTTLNTQETSTCQD